MGICVNATSAWCRQHPWFNQHLPRYLAVIQADTLATAPLIDTDMVDEVTKLGFDREEVIHSVKTRQQNKVRSVPPLLPTLWSRLGALLAKLSTSGVLPDHSLCLACGLLPVSCYGACKESEGRLSVLVARSRRVCLAMLGMCCVLVETQLL